MSGKCNLLLSILYYLLPYLVWKTVPPPGKIRYIRLQSVFVLPLSFFPPERGFIGLTRMARSWVDTVPHCVCDYRLAIITRALNRRRRSKSCYLGNETFLIRFVPNNAINRKRSGDKRLCALVPTLSILLPIRKRIREADYLLKLNLRMLPSDILRMLTPFWMRSILTPSKV